MARFGIGETDLQLRLGRQVVNWGESVFIQGVNQINPIDVPAARRPGAELKEVLLPVAMAYANWGFGFGSMEALLPVRLGQHVDRLVRHLLGRHREQHLVEPRPVQQRDGHHQRAGQRDACSRAASSIPQLGSNVFAQANGLFVPLVQGDEASDSGQFGVAFRFPVEKLDTEFGFYGMNIHSRLPFISGRAGTHADDTPDAATGRAGPARTAVPDCGDRPIGRAAVLADSRHRRESARSQPMTRRCAIRRRCMPASARSSAQTIVPGRAFWEYPEDIQVYGISAATNLVRAGRCPSR